MPNNSYSSRMLGNWSDSVTVAKSGLLSYQLTLVKYLQTFPTQIANRVFNIIYVFGILSNILLLLYLFYYKRYKTPVFCVMLSLGVADLCVCVALFLWYSCVSPFIVGPLWLCNAVQWLSHLSILASSYHIAVFAVLRFVQLVYPLKSHAKVTSSLMSKVCLTIWAIDFIEAVVIARYVEPVNISALESSDIYVCLQVGTPFGRYVLIIWVMIIWIFVPFITTSGFHVAKQLSVMLSRITTVTSQDEQVQHVRKQTDSRALAAIIAMYLISMAPYIIQAVRVFLLNRALTQLDNFIYEVCKQIAYTNSAINPWIYLFGAESVRSDIRKMITCNRWMNKSTAKVL